MYSPDIFDVQWGIDTGYVYTVPLIYPHYMSGGLSGQIMVTVKDKRDNSVAYSSANIAVGFDGMICYE